jgi:methyl-accepting chemotaxis protein
VRQGEDTINRVVGRGRRRRDGACRRQTADLGARGEHVREEVQQLMVAFQFQDRVQQILDQVHQSIDGAADAALRSDRRPYAPDESRVEPRC